MFELQSGYIYFMGKVGIIIWRFEDNQGSTNKPEYLFYSRIDQDCVDKKVSMNIEIIGSKKKGFKRI